MSTEDDGFGVAKIEREFEGYKLLKLKTPDQKKGEEKTELVVRLLPSMKSYKDTGEWKFYYGNHFGHYGNNSRNPEKPRARPFGCIQKKNKQKEILTACPKCTQIAAKQAVYDAREEELFKASGLTDKKQKEFYEIKKADKALKIMGEWLGKHNCDKKFWINVMTLDGAYGVLQLSYTTVVDKLEPFLKEMRDKYKIDVFAPSKGLWIKFTRTGIKPRVTDGVEAFTETVTLPDGNTAEMKKAAPMTKEQIQQALKICPDLKTDVVKFLSPEKIQELVDSNGDPDLVDKAWAEYDAAHGKTQTATKTKTGSLESAAPASNEPEVEAQPLEEEVAPVKAAAPAPAPAPAVEVDAEEAALEAQMKALQERKAAKAAAQAASAPTTLGASGGDPQDAFLAKFNAAKQ